MVWLKKHEISPCRRDIRCIHPCYGLIRDRQSWRIQMIAAYPQDRSKTNERPVVKICARVYKDDYEFLKKSAPPRELNELVRSIVHNAVIEARKTSTEEFLVAQGLRPAPLDIDIEL